MPPKPTKPYLSAFRNDLMEGQVVVVTGGGTGIGRTIAHELASIGALVVIAARRVEKLQSTVDEIKSLGGKADFVQLNIREEESCYAALKEVVKRHGRLDGLVNNAGGQFTAPASTINGKGFRTVVELNLVGTYLMIRAAYDVWMKENGGSIVNILANFENGYVWYSHSAAARAGVANLSYSLIQEWSPRSGIRINNVAPGVILGGGIVSGHYPKQVIESALELEHKMPAGRFGTESEVAAAVTFLLSPAAAYINGSVIKVDGGYALRQGVHGAFGPLYTNESHTPVYNGWGTTDEDVERMGYAQPFSDMMKGYVKIGKKGKGGSKL